MTDVQAPAEEQGLRGPAVPIVDVDARAGPRENPITDTAADLTCQERQPRRSLRSRKPATTSARPLRPPT